MITDHCVTVPATPDETWAILMDIPRVATCVPGMESVHESAPDTYAGVIGVRVGPVSVRLEGQVKVTIEDAAKHEARMDIEATDRRIRGAVSAKSSVTLEPREDGQTDLVVHTEASIFGKLGQFGQAVLKRKADQLVGEWAECVARQLAPAAVDSA